MLQPYAWCCRLICAVRDSEEYKNVHLRRSKLLDTKAGQPLAHVDALLNRFVLDKTSNEATGKRITSTVGVADLLGVNGMHWVRLGALALGSNDGWEGTLGNDGNSLPLGVLLWQIGQVLGNLSDVGGLETVALGIGQSLSLVTDDDVPVWGALVKGVLEELADEWGGEGDDEGLVVLCGLLSDGLDGLRADGEVVTADVDGLGVLNQAPDLGSLQVLNLVVVGSSEISAHATVVAGDDDTATSGWVVSIDAILNTETGLLVGLLESSGVLVVADAANVNNRLLGENVLCATGSVLGSATSDELGIEVVEEVLVKTEMLLFGKNSIVLLQTVLVKESLVSSSLNV